MDFCFFVSNNCGRSSGWVAVKIDTLSSKDFVTMFAFSSLIRMFCVVVLGRSSW